MHYANMPIPIEADKPINCEQLGAHISTAKKELVGFYPVKSEFHQVLQDRILTGKLSFFENGIIFNDMRLGAFVLPYDAID